MNEIRPDQLATHAGREVDVVLAGRVIDAETIFIAGFGRVDVSQLVANGVLRRIEPQPVKLPTAFGARIRAVAGRNGVERELVLIDPGTESEWFSSERTWYSAEGLTDVTVLHDPEAAAEQPAVVDPLSPGIEVELP